MVDQWKTFLTACSEIRNQFISELNSNDCEMLRSVYMFPIQAFQGMFALQLGDVIPTMGRQLV